jgi:uroporphyrinogen decarboxylase
MPLIIDTLNGIETAQVPIWIMRQAGRYLPEYRHLRKNFSSFIEFCLTPSAAAEATMQPLQRFGLDAAIIFSDILIVPHALGLNVDFQEGKGPILNPIISASQLEYDNRKFQNVYEALKLVKNRMRLEFADKALIGFAGAPWTVACYMLEGKSSKDFSGARRFCYTHKEEMLKIINLLIESTAEYLIGQIESGADIIKIFDSWAGLLPCNLFREFVIEPTRQIVKKIKSRHPNTPIIGFPKGAGVMYTEYAQKTNVDCIALDHGILLPWAKDNIQQVLQGNLDNALLFGSKTDISQAALEILDAFKDRALIFNLGHGVLPGTPIENVEHLVNIVKNYRKA